MSEIEVQNLGRYFGSIKAVDGISFSVNKGEVLGFLGPNGAGKSTTMKVITGYLSPTFGKVSVLGMDIERDSLSIRQRLGYLPENAPLYGEMEVGYFLGFIAEVRGMRGVARQDAVSRVVEMTGLKSVLRQNIETLSKGYKRRVGLAQALIHDPSVLILDEPTDGLDPNQKYEVRRLINQMAAEKCIILSTHILEEVDEVCTRVVVVSDGKIVADDTPAKLKERSPSFGAITVTFEGDVPADFVSTVQHLSGVKQVTELQKKLGTKMFYVYPSQGQSVLPALAAEAQKRGWRYAGLGEEQGYLDEVFREITRYVTH